jgi:hypothetical protein
VLRLLRRIAEAVDDGADHAEAEGHQARRVRERRLLVEDVLLRGRPARAAGLFRPGGRDPALLVKDAVPLLEERLLDRDADAARRRDLARELFPQELPDILPERLVGLAEREIHLSLPLFPKG